jgi:spermidine/putrescine transport system permease protein
MSPKDATPLLHRRGPLLLAPTWLILGVFFLAPLAIVLLYSFARRGTYGGFAPIDDLWRWVTSGAAFGSYARTLHADYLRTFYRSLSLASLTTLLCVLVSFPIAY